MPKILILLYLFLWRYPIILKTLVCPLVEDSCMATMAHHQSSQALSLLVSLLLYTHVSERGNISTSTFKSYVFICSWTLYAGLSGGINRSSGDIKREEKEEDENRSVADKSEDETRDMNGHLRTRCLKHLCHIVVIMLLFSFRQKY